MAVKPFNPGPTKIVVRGRANPHQIPAKFEEAPGGLYPIRMAVWNTDEYRIANGWPVTVPETDVRARTLVSAAGEVLAYRAQAREVETTSSIRWIADEDFYDQISLQWFPYQADSSVLWVTSAEYAPSLVTDYEYEISKEIYTQTMMNFDADSYEHMWADLSPVIGGTSGYTVLMCASMNSVYGNTERLPFSGLWCPGLPTPPEGEGFFETPEGGWVSLTLQGGDLYLESDQSPREKAVSISHLTSTDAPTYVAMVVGRPYTEIYTGRGPSSMTKTVMNIGKVHVPMSSNVVLGRDNNSIRHTSDMALMDLSLYAEQLTPTEIRDEVASLAQAYGGDR